ncbi:hypothetical protein BpHYR1_050366 [Brachionus plicatilis]|uniref:Uncharacterized protein n=1 Tax=Brachionus plicatilis TaxID=10195 RepID=A0A3M7SUL2_BRAPC|nr:hypothetical protein BpHYR1_050366 [Brachionus plicatilis]
MCHIGSKQKFT